MMITMPSGEGPISCAVFYADNMVYAPQWRMGNFVRIETMVLNMDEYDSAKDLTVSDTDLYGYDGSMFETGEEQQAALNNVSGNSDEILQATKMVSVSYIEMTITGPDDKCPYVLAAGWDSKTREKVIDINGLGRHVNKMGHVIYGTLWDTTGFNEGVYTVTTRLGVVEGGVGVTDGLTYNVDYAICNLWLEEEVPADPDHPYADLAGTEDDPVYDVFKNGLGNVTLDGDGAWIELGQLIPQGSGGGNGGDNGNGGEGGNGNGGQGGNGNGGGHRFRGK